MENNLETVGIIGNLGLHGFPYRYFGPYGALITYYLGTQTLREHVVPPLAGFLCGSNVNTLSCREGVKASPVF